jgi:acetylornithine/succinyldiaminopimelate/putrescine aminotransferase
LAARPWPARRASPCSRPSPKILDNVRTVGGHLRSSLAALGDKYEAVKAVRGAGLMLGIVVEAGLDLKPVLAKAQKAGLLALTAGENVLRLLPPLTISIEQADEAVRILDTSLAESLADA